MAKQQKAKKNNKSRKFSFNSITGSRKNFSLFIVVSIFVIGGLALGASSFAAPKNLKVCNSANSTRTIQMYRFDNNGKAINKLNIIRGDCKVLKNHAVRVDTDASNQASASNASYRLGIINRGGSTNYGKCHKSSVYWRSNPPNNAPYGVRYQTYDNAFCHGRFK